MKRKTVTKDELYQILRKHKFWLIDDPEGERADLREAHLRWADLQGAHLQRADLREADLREAHLQGADLQRADLRWADLRWADLQGADLRWADLQWADLREADLREAHLQGADLRWADLQWADLQGADLREAHLQGADLQRADIQGADLREADCPLCCPEKGSFIGFKKASGHIVELLIPEDAKRCSATGRKCRCSKATIRSITNLDGTEAEKKEVFSNHDRTFVYKIGETVEVADFEENRWKECAPGIHFFITRQEAVHY